MSCSKRVIFCRQIPNTTQLVLFSATYPIRLERYIGQFLGTAPKNQVRLHKIEELAIRVVRQFYIDCEDEEDRFSLLSDLYKVMTISKSIIFVDVRFRLVIFFTYLLATQELCLCEIDLNSNLIIIIPLSTSKLL
jgi:superfamily II DNA/RNA helicase